MIRTKVEWGILGIWEFSPTEGSPRLNRRFTYGGCAVGLKFASAGDLPHNKAAAAEWQPVQDVFLVALTYFKQLSRNEIDTSDVSSGPYSEFDHGIIGSDLVQVTECGEVETGAVEQRGGTVGQHGDHPDVHHLRSQLADYVHA